jgi:non-specific serine/threonine protein kinase
VVDENVQSTRYRYLETIRRYAGDRLSESDETVAARQRHLAWCLDLAECAEPHWWDARQGELLETIDAEYENIRVALEWSLGVDPDAGAQLVGSLWPYWYLRRRITEGSRWLHAMIERPARDKTLRAKVLLGAGYIAHGRYEFDLGRSLAEESLSIFREIGDKRSVGWALDNLASLALMAGEVGQARAQLEESLANFQEVDFKPGIGKVLRDLGVAAEGDGDLDRAWSYYSASTTLLRGVQDCWNLGWSVRQLGVLAWLRGDHRQAKDSLFEALGLFRDIDARGDVAGLLRDLGNLTEQEGDHARARTLLQESLHLSREVGMRSATVKAIYSLGFHAVGVGAVTRGVQLLGAGAALLPLIALHGPERVAYDVSLAQARTVLGEEPFALAWSRGQAETLEQAVAYALEDNGG